MHIPNEIEVYRLKNKSVFDNQLLATSPGDNFGAFLIPGPCGRSLFVMVSDGDLEEGVPWEHVSVSNPKSTPNWKEMCFIKKLFFESTDWVMQLHPPEANNISLHDFCLHLWRPLPEAGVIPIPPAIAVAPPN